MEFKEITDEILTVLEERNKRYGDNNLLSYGLMGLVIRISDKISRIINQISDDSLTDEEKNSIIQDQLIDISGYSINGLRLMKENRIDFLGSVLKDYKIIKK